MKKKQHIAADMLKLHKDNPYPAKDPTPEEIKAHFETFKDICNKEKTKDNEESN